MGAHQFGFRAVISTSFAEAHLQAELAEEFAAADCGSGGCARQNCSRPPRRTRRATVKIDLPKQTLTTPSGRAVEFPVDGVLQALPWSNGVDELGYILSHEPAHRGVRGGARSAPSIRRRRPGDDPPRLPAAARSPAGESPRNLCGSPAPTTRRHRRPGCAHCPHQVEQESQSPSSCREALFSAWSSTSSLDRPIPRALPRNSCHRARHSRGAQRQAQLLLEPPRLRTSGTPPRIPSASSPLHRAVASRDT